jgi:tetratricopeptide (TPR) repeat protein
LQIESQYNLGKAYADAKVYTQAERYFLTTLKINQRLWQACVGMGIVYYYVGPVEKAIAWFKEAERLSPNEAAVLGGLALCNALQGDLLEAERLFIESIKHNARNPENLANLGWIYIQMEKYHEAADFIERAARHTDRNGAVFNNLALCNLHMGASEVALKYFRRALETDPHLVSVHYNLGHVYHVMKSSDLALREWIMATEQEPGLADAFVNVGVSYYRTARFDMAQKFFQKVVNLRQDRMEDFLNLGLAYARLNKNKEAIEQFDRAIQIAPRNPMVHSNRGLACYFAKQVEEAMKEWRIVSQLSAAYSKSREKKQQSEYDESAVDFLPLYINERALHAPPASGDFLYAMLPGYSASRWELIISDPDIKQIPELKAQQAHFHRQLNALHIG